MYERKIGTTCSYFLTAVNGLMLTDKATVYYDPFVITPLKKQKEEKKNQQNPLER